jgi:hypothetical protein
MRADADALAESAATRSAWTKLPSGVRGALWASALLLRSRWEAHARGSEAAAAQVSAPGLPFHA